MAYGYLEILKSTASIGIERSVDEYSNIMETMGQMCEVSANYCEGAAILCMNDFLLPKCIQMVVQCPTRK
jgi:hypothetical protein